MKNVISFTTLLLVLSSLYATPCQTPDYEEGGGVVVVILDGHKTQQLGTHDCLTVENGSITLTLRDVDEKEVCTKSFTGSLVDLDVRHLPAGNYTLQFSGGACAETLELKL